MMQHLPESFFDRPRSPEEVATFFGCDEKFIYKEIREGRLQGRKLSGRMIRLMPEDIRAWLDQASTLQTEPVRREVN
jgi:excisionase family DNA binding protein